MLISILHHIWKLRHWGYMETPIRLQCNKKDVQVRVNIFRVFISIIIETRRLLKLNETFGKREKWGEGTLVRTAINVPDTKHPPV